MNDQSESRLRIDRDGISQRVPSDAEAGGQAYHQNPDEIAQRYLFPIPLEGREKPLLIAIEVPRRAIEDENSAGPRKDSLDEEFERESTAFAKLLPDLQKAKPGRFVAVYGGKAIDDDTDEFVLAERIQRDFHGRFVLIRCVSKIVPEDRLESPEVETE